MREAGLLQLLSPLLDSSVGALIICKIYFSHHLNLKPHRIDQQLAAYD